jgi:hypothetical protein
VVCPPRYFVSYYTLCFLVYIFFFHFVSHCTFCLYLYTLFHRYARRVITVTLDTASAADPSSLMINRNTDDVKGVSSASEAVPTTPLASVRVQAQVYLMEDPDVVRDMIATIGQRFFHVGSGDWVAAGGR